MGLDNPLHIVLLLIILLLVFGAKRLPEMGRSLGAGLRGFKESISGESETIAPLARGVGEHSPIAVISVSPPPEAAGPRDVEPLPHPAAARPPAAGTCSEAASETEHETRAA